MVPHPYLIVALPFVLLPPALVTLFMMDLTFDSLAPGIVYGSMPRIARVALRAAYKLRLVEASLDVFLIAAAYFAAFLIRLDFAILPWHGELLLRSLPWVLAATYPAFAITGVYRGMWRYTGLADAVRFANGAVAAGLCLLVISRFVPLGLSGSILVLFIILLFNLLAASRMSFRLLRKGSRGGARRTSIVRLALHTHLRSSLPRATPQSPSDCVFPRSICSLRGHPQADLSVECGRTAWASSRPVPFHASP